MRSLSGICIVLIWATSLVAAEAEKTFVISGRTSVPGVRMIGLPGNVVSDENGLYGAKVAEGWSGTVMPAKEGYRFNPPQRSYQDVDRDCTGEDYVASVLTFVISGNAGVAGAKMQGLPGDPVTDENGAYSSVVAYGWIGAVRPVKRGYHFGPPQRVYQTMVADKTGQDYSARQIEYAISGMVGLPGVAMQGLPGAPLTDSRGFYVARLPYGWSGAVTPVKAGFTFEPPQRRYFRVTGPLEMQDYTPVRVAVDPALPDGTGRLDVLLIPSDTIDPQAQAEIQEDMQVMLQVLRDMLSEPRMILGILYDYGDIFAGGGQDARAFYLQSYGALFVLEVDFPFLRAEPNLPEENAKRAVDPVWQRARQRLRGSGSGPAYGQRPSDEVSFEQLKTDLIETLKHTANIRHIDPNEQIIFTIVSRAEAGGMSGYSAGYFSASGGRWGAGSSYSYSVGGFSSGATGSGGRVSQLDQYGKPKHDALGNTIHQAAPTPPAQPTPGPTSVLTIRVKKADVDAFAAGQIDLQRFQQRVAVFND